MCASVSVLTVMKEKTIKTAGNPLPPISFNYIHMTEITELSTEFKKRKEKKKQRLKTFHVVKLCLLLAKSNFLNQYPRL